MAGGWGSIVDAQGRFCGAGTIEHGGDAEEMAEELFGMIWWLASAATPRPTRAARVGIIREAEQRYQDGLRIGGRSHGDEPGYWE